MACFLGSQSDACPNMIASGSSEKTDGGGYDNAKLEALER